MTIRTNDAPMLKYGEQSNLGPPLRIFESLPPLGPRDKVIVPIFEDLKFYLKKKKIGIILQLKDTISLIPFNSF